VGVPVAGPGPSALNFQHKRIYGVHAPE
jgi:hypothetical protein